MKNATFWKRDDAPKAEEIKAAQTEQKIAGFRKVNRKGATIWIREEEGDRKYVSSNPASVVT